MTQTVFNIYCDESRHTSDPADRYAIIGALQCPMDQKRRIVHRIHSLQAKYNTHGEFGWKRLSPNRCEFYNTMRQVFLEEACLHFRCIVVDRTSFENETYNNGDSELGFYKMYYQMLVHWLEPGHRYRLFLDWQQNASSSRFSDLKTILSRKLSGRAHIQCLEPVSSHNQPLIQLADLLIGAVGYQWNGRTQSLCKHSFAADLARSLGRVTLKASTYPGEKKFNIFHFTGRH
ncbi:MULTISPECIES: DUF3800 domain-containing protein [unclassified Endozoicomonas]|uniref:DUF3800 domain-containing protein n=1 Tax=unclassified Endozoicomonas TaxID=2644528 RepID=UPI003BB5347E